MGKNTNERYYEETDFSELFKTQRVKKINAAAKRITLNISDQIYDEANELDLYMRMGYQNVLKTAMTLGLTELYNQVSNHKIDKTKSPRLPSWPARRKKTGPKIGSTAHNSRNTKRPQLS